MSDSEGDGEDKWRISFYSIKRDISNNFLITGILSYLSLVLAQIVAYHIVEGLTIREAIHFFMVELFPTGVAPTGPYKSYPFLFFTFLFLFLIVSVAIVVFISRWDKLDS